MPIAVLLIDDNQDQITITKKVLSKTGQDYHIEAASTGQQGLERFSAGLFDLVLCDYRLPDLDGVEVLKRLRAGHREVPFIIVTSMGNERLAVDAMKLGASDYVVKDASYDMVLPEVLRQAVDRYRARQQLAGERNAALEALKKEKAQLETINRVMMDRERRIIDLKREVNALLSELGKPKKYA